eukprot:TRINITY_DN5532_c0_g2_i1.p1 TRINITY_DN5532_c0_g2~~TRINITY_DN5532_c0_g2_i1.p1  ORF type:complete len:611 (+),score=121.94 TRINITY_DN5532_c0_g2_i1:276-1835(+)
MRALSTMSSMVASKESADASKHGETSTGSKKGTVGCSGEKRLNATTRSSVEKKKSANARSKQTVLSKASRRNNASTPLETRSRSSSLLPLPRTSRPLLKRPAKVGTRRRVTPVAPAAAAAAGRRSRGSAGSTPTSDRLAGLAISAAGSAAAAHAQIPTSFTRRQCRFFLGRFSAISGLPGDVAEKLLRLGKAAAAWNSGGSTGADAALCLVSMGLVEAAKDIETHLRAAVAAARATADSEKVERGLRTAAQAAAESRLAELRADIGEKKATIRSLENSIGERRLQISNAKAEQRTIDGDIRHVTGKKRRLDDAEQQALCPLKETAASGAHGLKRLKVLKKLGKEHKFHGELMSVLPSILRKHPDKRRTFDAAVVHHLEREFAAQSESLQSSIRGSEKSAERCRLSVEAAAKALAEAKDGRRRIIAALASAERDVDECKRKVVEEKRRVKNLPRDMQRAAALAEKEESRLNKFLNGPLSALHAILAPSPMASRSDSLDGSACFSASASSSTAPCFVQAAD